MGRHHVNYLLSEGKDDVYAIAGLMANHVHWGSSEDEWPVKLEAAGSDTELLNAAYISSSFKRSGLEALGVLLDANDNFESRWASIRNVCAGFLPEVPDQLPEDGLVVHGDQGKRFGVWIMPDNRSSGMLETFLNCLVPADGQELCDHARNSADKARELGAPFKSAHEDKALIHTWLAWQDPPGRPFGEALKAKCLDPHSPTAAPFVEWFIKLFELERTGSAAR